jgi:hypothetical protein
MKVCFEENEMKWQIRCLLKNLQVKYSFFKTGRTKEKSKFHGVKIDSRVVMRKFLAILEDLGLPDGNG